MHHNTRELPRMQPQWQEAARYYRENKQATNPPPEMQAKELDRGTRNKGNHGILTEASQIYIGEETVSSANDLGKLDILI